MGHRPSNRQKWVSLGPGTWAKLHSGFGAIAIRAQRDGLCYFGSARRDFVPKMLLTRLIQERVAKRHANVAEWDRMAEAPSSSYGAPY